MPRRARSPFSVLAMLSLGPRSGYEISRQQAMSIGHFWAESNGQLYPALRTLVRQGLAKEKSRARAGRRQISYAITPEGRRALVAWLREPSPLPSSRNEMLLKLFVGWHVAPDVQISQIEDMRDGFRNQLQYFSAVEHLLAKRRAAAPAAEYWRLTVRAGELTNRARLEWCEEALAALRKRPPLKGRTRARASRGMNEVMRLIEVDLRPLAGTAAEPHGKRRS